MATKEIGDEAGFYAKGESKSSVAVQHSKLTSQKAQKDVAKRKAYWGELLERLK